MSHHPIQLLIGILSVGAALHAAPVNSAASLDSGGQRASSANYSQLASSAA